MAKENWKPMLKLTIARDEKFMGPGCRELLRRIEQCGSVRQASEAMGMSYSKAWRILGILEEQAGFPAVARRQGGKAGGESSLTPEGKRLLERYEACERECKLAVRAIFQRHFASEAEETPS